MGGEITEGLWEVLSMFLRGLAGLLITVAALAALVGLTWLVRFIRTGR